MRRLIVPDHKSRAVHALAAPRRRVRVFAGLDHELTVAEDAAAATRPIQRMTRLRQTGLAYLAFPTSEHTRMAHCLGTTHWVARFIESMRTNGYAESTGDGAQPAGGRDRLAQLDTQLGPDLSLDLLARLFALIHDSDLLPLGHTLSHQLGHFKEPGQATRFQRYIDRMRPEVTEAFPEVEDAALRAEMVQSLLRHLDAVEAIAALRELIEKGDYEHPRLRRGEVVSLLPAGLFIDDLVTSNVSADLLDFALRDTLGAGMPWNFDNRFLGSVCVFGTPGSSEIALLLKENGLDAASPLFRFGVNACRDGGLAHDVPTAVIALLRVRYEVLERVVYDRRKCIADAMVDRAIRNIGDRFTSEHSEEALLRLGDDELLNLLAAEEALADFPAGTGPAASELLAGRLFSEVYRLADRDRLTDFGRSAADAARSPATRAEVEARILQRVPQLHPADVVFSSRPLTMQAKEPDTLIGWVDGSVRPLAEIAKDLGYGTEALAITARYDALWSLSLYVRPQVPAAAREQVRLAAIDIFEK